ncbi:MAG: GTPase HflX, partial [Bdellovibrionales bacterium]|nr:GTPase HflX [Bdellovibrionales bacterium]
SRLGGGIGTRGPGESALEMDRRRIHNRVKQIRKKLEVVKKNREQYRQKRQRNEIPQFALIGYTNSGKSTLLNQLTKSDVYVKDQVFATLDPTTRKIHLPEVDEAVITDTVGFIRNLPPQLIEAFKATLEESGQADILVVVADISSEQMNKHLEVIDHLINEFAWNNKPIVYVFNKVDQATIEKQVRVDRKPRVFTSALKGEGIERLRRMLAESVKNLQKEVELFFPKQEEHRIYELGRESQIKRTEAASHGTICYVMLTPNQMSKWGAYLTKVDS